MNRERKPDDRPPGRPDYARLLEQLRGAIAALEAQTQVLLMPRAQKKPGRPAKGPKPEPPQPER